MPKHSSDPRNRRWQRYEFVTQVVRYSIATIGVLALAGTLGMVMVWMVRWVT